MEVRILGSVGIRGDGEFLSIDVPKERALLATLALGAPHPVSTSRLIAALWGEDPPDTAEKTLQWHVSKLRKTIGRDRLQTGQGSYLLDVPSEAVDALRFAGLVAAASELLRDGRPNEAEVALADADDLWGGEILEDVAEGDFRIGQRARFQELRDLADELKLEAAIALGRHAESIPDLEAMVAEHQYREKAWQLLMLAMYRSGRQVDALRTFQRLRTILVNDLGTEPSTATRALEERILRQDPQLDVVPPPPPHNLHMPLASFIGRAAEERVLDSALDSSRLVSLVGPGGVGKTRLAIEVARNRVREYPDGVTWVDLVGLRSPAALADWVVRVVGAPRLPGARPEDELVRHMGARRLLLVIDNCEHVVEAVTGLVVSLLSACPELRIMCTTRIALGLDGEERILVPPMDVGTEAVELFMDRCAQRGVTDLSDHQLDAVREICAHLEGIPLAVELTAARTPLLAPSEMRDHLRSHLDAPGVAGADRHDSLEAALDWSYDLLDDATTRLFDELSVFAGSFDLPAASSVASLPDEALLPALSSLVDASMLVAFANGHGERRFRLMEPLRLYGRTHLDPDSWAVLSGRHADHYRALCVEQETLQRPMLDTWRRYLAEMDHNFTQALQWSAEHVSPTDALAFADALGDAMYRRGEYRRCAAVLGPLLAAADDAPPRLRANARLALCWCAFLSGDGPLAFESVTTAEQEGIEASEGVLVALARANLAQMLVLGVGDVASALPLFDAAISACREVPGGYGTLLAWSLAMKAQALGVGDINSEDASGMLDEAETIFGAFGETSGIAHVWMARAIVALKEGDFTAAHHAAKESARMARDIGDAVYEQIGLVMAGIALFKQGAVGAAIDSLFQSILVCERTNNVMQLGVACLALGGAAIRSGDRVLGVRLWGAGSTLAAPYPVFERLFATELEEARGDLGDRFDVELSVGAALDPAEVMLSAASVGSFGPPSVTGE